MGTHDETPSAAILDSQSVKGSASGGEERGLDGGKLIKGRKQHLMVTTEGLPISVRVTAASTDDRFATMEMIKAVEAAPPPRKVPRRWGVSRSSGPMRATRGLAPGDQA